MVIGGGGGGAASVAVVVVDPWLQAASANVEASRVEPRIIRICDVFVVMLRQGSELWSWMNSDRTIRIDR